MESSFYNLPFLLKLRHTLARLDPDAAEEQLEMVGQLPSAGRRLGVLAASFNPLTRAHIELARAALDEVDAVLYALSVRIVDKEYVSGMALEDRALLFDLLELPLALLNRGLYVEQAEAIHRHVPGVILSFIVGFDKIVQIFDPRYYQDRDAALERLFHLSRFLVAPRGNAGAEELAALLAAPENRRFAEYVRYLQVPQQIAMDSSSDIRAAVATGSRLPQIVPPLVDEFILATRCYAPPLELPGSSTVDCYAIRLEILAALDRLALPDAPFESLVKTACSPAGSALRAALSARDDRMIARYIQEHQEHE